MGTEGGPHPPCLQPGAPAPLLGDFSPRSHPTSSLGLAPCQAPRAVTSLPGPPGDGARPGPPGSPCADVAGALSSEAAPWCRPGPPQASCLSPPLSVLDIGERPGGWPLPGPRCGCFKCHVLLSFQGFLSALFSPGRELERETAHFLLPPAPRPPLTPSLPPRPGNSCWCPCRERCCRKLLAGRGGANSVPPQGVSAALLGAQPKERKLSCTRLPGAAPRPRPLVPVPIPSGQRGPVGCFSVLFFSC